MIGLLLTVAIIGLIVWLLTTQVPMPQPFKTVIWVLAIIFLLVYLMRALGIADIPIPTLR